MASHSSSFMATTQSCFTYDVFLSFRGEDTRKNFTDHLYTALKQAGIRTFRDDDAMERGKLLKPELQKAIHESAISLIVFSESYATSKWCLDEVKMIIEKHETSSSKHEVVPVFYEVEPSDVRNQRGSFGEAFDAYDDEIRAERNLQKKEELVVKVGAWRNALRKAATLTGMVSVDGYEAKFIINIVNVVKKKLDYKALYIEDKLVGMEDDVADTESWLQDPSPDAVILLIDGMGGIGKTTLAKCIYNSNFCNYDGSCFLANISEVCNEPRGLPRLQSQLISTILKSEKGETIWNVHEGTVKVTNAICSKKVLLILDDVTTLQQLEALLGRQKFYSGSKVIITTRNKGLLTAFKVHPKVQSVRRLRLNDATELFSLYAFRQDQPTEQYIVQSQLFVLQCMGLPLALKVLGSSLRGSTEDVWEDTMCKLDAIPNPDIQNVLQISYETLADDKDKDLFLHVACFFEGMEKEYIVKLLGQCDLYPVVGIKNLMDRCLLDVEYGRVRMHRLIKEMGREVVRQESPKDPGKRSRLWHHQDCLNVLQDNSGTKKVEGFMLDMKKIKEAKSTYLGKTMQGNNASFKIGAVEKMKNLMLLQLNYVIFSGRAKNLPKKLRLLSWHGFLLKYIPDDICLERLVVLDMSYSKLKRVWVNFKFIGSLKILNLSHSVELIKTPDFGGLPGLESLILKGCSSLIKVDESVANLKELVLLDLTDCRSLREFPSLPTSIVSVEMSGCPNLGVLGPVQSLNSVSPFSVLKRANFAYCNLLDDSFPNDWSSLVSLMSLNIDGNNVTYLPNCIQTLPRIQSLSADYCPKIESILGLPESINTLYLGDNESLEKVQPAKNSKMTVYKLNCPKLYEIEGRYKFRSRDKVDRKIIRYLGLESNAGEGIELDPKVLHEFGIFSTFVSEGQIPSCFMFKEMGPEEQIPSCFMFKERAPEISFEVPWNLDGLRISGFNICAVYTQSSGHPGAMLWVKVHNRTKDLLWHYYRGFQHVPNNVGKFALLSVWRCHNLLEGGDQIGISISSYQKFIVEECCISLLCEDGEQFDGERNAFDQISWTDRMDKDISDYVYNGANQRFSSSKENF